MTPESAYIVDDRDVIISDHYLSLSSHSHTLSFSFSSSSLTHTVASLPLLHMLGGGCKTGGCLVVEIKRQGASVSGCQPGRFIIIIRLADQLTLEGEHIGLSTVAVHLTVATVQFSNIEHKHNMHNIT